jgi:hypothetical protein
LVVSGAPIGGGTPLFMGLLLQDNQGTSFLNDSLPTLLDASAFEFRNFSLSFGIPVGGCDEVCVAPTVLASITSLQVEPTGTAPEPATVTVTSLALAAFALRRRAVRRG